jgi:thiol-disulfide isomerase/thioredoxin
VLLFAPASTEAAEVAIGSTVGELAFKDIRYLNRSLKDCAGKSATVLVFTSTSCPLVARYFPTLKKLEAEYRGKGVQFVAVNVGPDDSIVAMANQAIEFDVPFPFVKDVEDKAPTALGVTRTPEVAVLDARQRLRYRGRIDDQYRPGAARPAPTRHDLKEALDAVLAGREPEVTTTAVDGCPITAPALPEPGTPVTFHEHVAPVLRKHCAGCHREGTAAPFTLWSYEQARARGRAISEVVRDGRMPPWFAPEQHGPFVNRRGLSAAERTVVLQWVRGGMPAGKEPARPEPAPAAAEEWEIGTPDLVLKTGEFELPAEGDVPYRYSVLTHLFTEDTWVQGVQVLPENRRAVHHSNLAYLKIGEGFKTDNFITGFVPGGQAMQLENGVAYRIPAGSLVGLQIHFVTTGKPEKCRLAVGFRYAREKIQKQLRHELLVSTRYAIPPSDPAYAVRVTRTLSDDAIGVGLFAHMHLRGKAMTFTAVPPEGKAETLLSVPNYRFDWQLAYQWEPGRKRLPAGTRLECTAVYDNSAFNPFNPDPKATVRDGPQTYHEMLNGFVFYVREKEALGLDIDPKTGHVRRP